MKRIVIILFLALGLGAIPALAQPTFFEVTVENTSPAYPFFRSAVFNTPDGAAAPGPLTPGLAYTFSFDAAPGMALSFATMFVQSNDLFYAPGPEGIPLYDANGDGLSGDMTGMLMLWDAGTEVNEEPGEGPNQVIRQSGPDTGVDENGVVQLVNDGFTYPAATDVIQFTLTYEGGTRFTGRIENVSTATTLTTSTGAQLPVPLSPGVYVVHTGPAPLFTPGEPDREPGTEAIAEDGNPGPLAPALAAETGVTAILSPGVWAVHTNPIFRNVLGKIGPFFNSWEMDRGDGLEAIAEDGNPALLAPTFALERYVTGGAFAVPDGAAGPGPLTPGGAYTFTILAQPGAHLSLATMYVQSNDLFLSPDVEGFSLFNPDGTPISGDVTSNFLLWDAGTEVNEVPGAGPNQAPRQSGPDTGADENEPVMFVTDGFSYPAIDEYFRVTVQPLATERMTVRIENVSTATTLTTSTGAQLPVPLSPGVWAVHTDVAPLFTPGTPDREPGTEAIAEDGNPGPLGAALGRKAGYMSGVFNMPVGADAPGPLVPGGTYEFTVDAAPGARLSLATMFVQSNDLFYAPDEHGIALFNPDGTLAFGDVTSQLGLWDAGTEVNEEPGEGPNQVIRQSGPDTGADESGVVRLVNDGFTYPANDAVIRVTINPVGSVSTGIETPGDEILPEGFALDQNYPNPFNPETVIPFTLQTAGAVRLEVFNVLGQRVATLIDGLRSAGTHEVSWSARDQQGGEVPTGVYLYRLQIGDVSRVRQMVLLR